MYEGKGGFYILESTCEDIGFGETKVCDKYGHPILLSLYRESSARMADSDLWFYLGRIPSFIPETDTMVLCPNDGPN